MEPDAAENSIAREYLRARRRFLARVRERRRRVLDYILQQFPDERAFVEQAGEQVRSAAIVLGSPRGGTSVVKHVMSKAGGFLALPGEHRLFFTLLGLNFPDHGQLSECGERRSLSQEEKELLLTNLLYECRGDVAGDLSPREIERFGWEWALRFQLQWPDLEVDTERIVACVWDAIHQGPADREPRSDALAFEILRRVVARFPEVNPWYYDLDEQAVREAFPKIPKPGRSPAGHILEITPFVSLRPSRRRPLGQGTPVLLLKASSDCFRLPLLGDLLDGWELRFVHLTRNPIASVNGLLDGWHHHCFWQHELAPLGLDLPVPADCRQIARSSWKFDLFDGWQRHVGGPLWSLCAHQWRSSHERILGFRRSGEEPRTLQLPFEDFQSGGEARRRLLTRAVRFAGVAADDRLRQAVEQPRVINQTVPPSTGRWRRERPELIACLDVDEIRRLAERLGYDPAAALEWA